MKTDLVPQDGPVGDYLLFLPTLLSVIAGGADVCSFLGFGLFNAHITGNLVILAAHIVARGTADTALILSVPVFILALAMTRLLAAGFKSLPARPLPSLLLLQFLLLAGSFALCAIPGGHFNPNSGSAIIAGQLGVAAMAVQAALVQLSLHGGPSTAPMTANITRFVMDAGNVLLEGASVGVSDARHRVKQTWPVIVGFITGAALGALCFAAAGPKSMGFPAALALLAVVMSMGASPHGRRVNISHP